MVKFPIRLDEILPTSAMEKLLDVLQQPDISGKVREAMHKVGLNDSSALDRVRDAWQQARGWIDSLTDSDRGLVDAQLTLNATGQLLSKTFCSVPFAPSVAYGYAKAAANCQVTSVAARNAQASVESTLGSHATLWMNSVSEAMRVLVSCDQARDGIVLSRTDAVRIAGVGDVRAMLAASSNPLIEVGAANGVTAEDWQSCLNSDRQVLVLASPNNLAHSEAASHRTQAVSAARAQGARIIELLADGVIAADPNRQMLFPVVRECLASGVDVVVLPMHVLMGGPGVLVVGDAKLVDSARKTAETLGATLVGAGLAAATIAVQQSASGQAAESGVAAQLQINPENLKNRAHRLAVQLAGIGEIAEAAEVELTSSIGPSPWNRYQLTSFGVRLRPKNSLDDLVSHLDRSAGKRGIRLESTREADAVMLNLRFIPPEHDHEIVQVAMGVNEEKPAQPPS